MLKVGIIGVGTVGASVANILRDNKDLITARAGIEIVPVLGVVSNLNKDRNVSIKLTDNVDEVLNDESIDIVVELMGGIEKPYEIVKKALQKGKPVVTANKALLAYHRYELEEIICCLQRRINRLNYESEIILSLSMIDFTVWNSFRVGEKVGFIDVEFCEQNISLAYDLIHFIWQAEVMLGSENTAQQMGSFAENVIVSNIIQVFSIPESTARIYFDLYLIQSTLRALELYVKQDNLHKQGLLQIKLWLDLECIWLS